MAHSPPDFHLSLRYPQSNWAPLVLVPEWLGLCTPQAPVGLSNDLFCEAVRGGGAEREQWRPPHSPPDFSLSLRYPQSNRAPLVLVPEWVGLCTL